MLRELTGYGDDGNAAVQPRPVHGVAPGGTEDVTAEADGVTCRDGEEHELHGKDACGQISWPSVYSFKLAEVVSAGHLRPSSNSGPLLT